MRAASRIAAAGLRVVAGEIPALYRAACGHPSMAVRWPFETGNGKDYRAEKKAAHRARLAAKLAEMRRRRWY